SPLPPPEPAPDVSPVPAPGGLGLTIHLAHPRATFQQLSSVLGSVAAMFSGALKVDPESLVAMAVGAPVGSFVDLDQPMDFAVADIDTPGTTMKLAGAVVVSDPTAAREVLEKYYRATQTAPGVVRLEPRDDAPEGASPRPCVLAVSSGSDAGAARTTRLVCGGTSDAVRHLGPYLTRTMTRLTSRDDLRLEVFVRELRPTVTGRKELTPGGGSPVDGGASEPTDKLFDELVEKLPDDVGSVVLEASSDGSAVDVRVSTTFVDWASPLTRALVGAGTPAAPPPAAFERLPRDAACAFYGRGEIWEDLQPLRGKLVDSLREWLADDGYTPAAIDTQLLPFQRILTGGPWVAAAGVRLDTARAALDAYADGGKTTETARTRARAAMQGWWVAGVEEASQGWIDDLRALVKNDAVKPSGKPRRKHDPTKETTHLVVAPVPAALQLPAGTLHVEAHVAQNPEWTRAQKKNKSPVTDPVIAHTSHIFVVPDGARTWFAVAEDPALAAGAVRASLSGAAETGTLKSRRDLDPLRAMPASTAGFVSVASMAFMSRSDYSDEGLRKARESLLGLAGLTDQGAAPIPVALASTRAAATRAGAPGGDVKLRIVLPIRTGLEVAASPHPVF
ncbi:MAG: hypothetical protein ABSE49_33865, partial [Polyangiaceae bacterium]